MNKKFTKLIAALALLVFMTPSLAGWGQTRTETTIASWGKVSIAANTAIIASGGDATNNGTAQFSSTKAMTSAGGSSSHCYYSSSAGGAVITFSNLDLSGYTDITMTFYSRASQNGSMQIAWSSNGTSYTNLNAPSLSGTEGQKTSNEIPNTATHIRLTHNKTSGSLYFGTIVIKGTESVPSITVGSPTGTPPATPVNVDYTQHSSYTDGDLTPLAVTYANLSISGASDFAVQFYDGNGDNPNELDEGDEGYPDWVSSATVYKVGSDYKLGLGIDENEGDERYAYLKVYAAGDEDYVYSDFVTITQTARPAPSIAVTPSSLTGFTYQHNAGPSAAQSFAVSGSYLTANVSVTVPADGNFEICATQDGTYSNSLTLTQTSGTLASTNVYVRLKAGKAIAENYAGTVTLSSTGATNQTVSLSGSVTGYSVTYNGNGNTGGTAPTDGTAYAYNQSVTVLGNGDLVKTGHTFAGWNTQADGNGTNYAADASFNITANTTLYAKWTVNTHDVTLPDADNYGSYAMNQTNPIAYGTEVTLTYTPAAGYEAYAATWSVNGTAISDNKFNMPDNDVTVTVAVAEVHGTAINPYTVAEARAAIDNNTGITGVYTRGIVYSSNSVSSGTITYLISDDGTETNTLQVYRGKGLGNNNFSSVYDVKPGDIVVVYGNLLYYNNTTYEYNSGNYLTYIKPVISNESSSNPSEFGYSLQNGGPSAYQTIKVRGRNLTENLVITASEDYEICQTTNGEYSSPLSITTQNKTAYNIYVRLKSGLSRGTHNGTVTMTSADAVTQTVNLTGSVTGYTVTYNANGGEGTVTDNNDYDLNAEVTILGADGLSRTGYTFSHWDTQANDEGTDYAAEAVVNITSNLTLYAQWTAIDYTITKSAMSNGSVTVKIGDNEVTTGNIGQTVTLEVTPAANHKLSTLTVTKEGGGTVELSPAVSSSVLTYTFTMPADNVTVAATFAEASNVTFMVNGVVKETRIIDPYNALGELPTVSSSETPTGYTFNCWTPETDYFNATTAPAQQITAETVPTGDITYAAVFCISTPGDDHYTLTSAAPADGDELVLAALNNGTYYAFYVHNTTSSGASSVEGSALTVSDGGIITNDVSAIKWTVGSGSFTDNKITYSGLGLKDNEKTNNILHMNASAFKSASNWTNGIFEFTSSGDGYTMKRKASTARYLKYANNSFSVSDQSGDACTLYMFKNNPDAPTLSNFTTLVTIGENVTGSVSISGEVIATADFENNGTIVIHDGGILNMGSHTLTNTNPANLVIEDGGQLIVYDNGAKDDVQATMQKDIEVWTTEPVGGWYFIASPVNAAAYNPSAAGLITDDNSNPDNRTYDFYYLAYENGKPMWKNYRNATFNMANGQGYLYANASKQTLAFAGAIKPYSTDNNKVTLSQTGWNLIGNPFTCAVTVSTAFSEVNNGSSLTNQNASNTIMPCAGIAVYGEANEQVTFTMVEPQQSVAPTNPSLQLTLAQQATNRGSATLDNAIVNFNESSELPKFYFMQQNANIYIPQGIEKYAIVSTEATGELPVNFKVNENGTYTLTVSAESVEMNYLHLIDNMTGADTDLLSNPSYTFNAKTTDYESRFRLVFASATMNEDSDNETFAFFSNDQLVIINEGQATLQVIDVNGRILRNETINGSTNVSMSNTPGVYMLRLINGSDVKVQKIVVK